jgi:beta-galactosidase
VAWDQLELTAPARRRKVPVVARGAASNVREDSDRVVVEVGPILAEVDRSTGALVEFVDDGRPLLAGPLRLELWRAPTDNDGLKLRPVPSWRPLARWRAAGLDSLERTCTSVSWRRVGSGVRFTTDHELAPAHAPVVRHRQTLSIGPTGVEIADEVDIPEELTDLPRLGCSLLAPADLDHVHWLGLGPGECYPDRLAGAVVGRHEGPVDELPYLMPQEFGLRCEVRSWRLLDASGHGLAVEALDPARLAVSATHHTSGDLTEAVDTLSLRRRDEVVVHIDVAHRGLGTASCGPDTSPAFRLRAGRWRWRWWLGPA